MIKQIITASVLAIAALQADAAVSKVITCEVSGHRLTGEYRGGPDEEGLVISILGTKFKVDSKRKKIIQVYYEDGWATFENVKISETSKFTLYKFKYTGRYSDINRKFTYNFSYRIYGNGKGEAIMKQSADVQGEFVPMQAKGNCNNV